MSTYIKEYSIIVEVDEEFTGCDRCIHSEDPEEVCKARLCFRAIHELFDCYKERKCEGIKIADSENNAKWKEAIGTFKEELRDLTNKENNVGFISGEYAIKLIDKHTKDLIEKG